MAASKKLSVVAALVLMTLLSTGVASAQAPPATLGVISCSSTAVPPIVRAEGIAELVGDIVILCTNTSPETGGTAVSHLVTNVSVSLNVNVTNNLNPDPLTDAVLVINENNCTAPVALGGAGIGVGFTGLGTSCTGGAAAPDQRFQDPQFATLASATRLEWNGIHFPVPGGPAEPIAAAADDCTDTFTARDGESVSECNPGITSIRITSIRGNASQLGVPAIEGVPFSQIQAFVSITGPNTIPISNNVLNVAIPLTGLLVDIDPDAAPSGLQCEDESGHMSLTISEGFATSFKTLGEPTFQPGNTQVESGYYAPGSLNGGGASQSTRFLLRFFNIPEGVNVVVHDWVDCDDDDADTDLLVIQALDCDEVGDGCSAASVVASGDLGGLGFGSDPGVDVVQVDIDGGFGSIVYEVEDDDPIVSEDCVIPIWFGWTPDTENDLPAPGTGQLAVTFAPLSTVLNAAAGEPVPRFIDTGGDPTNVISIIKCTTQILFPFVTNRAGFDTGLVVANTSEDWLGTQPQDGTCTIHYHGTTAGDGASPPDDTSKVIQAGEQLIWLLSSGNPAYEVDPTPEFQGYVIVVCEFQFAHGYAFITDGFGSVPTLAQGYLALIIPVQAGGRVAGAGEALNQ